MKGRRNSFNPKKRALAHNRARPVARHASPTVTDAPADDRNSLNEIENMLPKGDALVAFLPEGKWFDNLAALPAVPSLPKGSKNPAELVFSKKKRGLMLYEALVSKYEHGALRGDHIGISFHSHLPLRSFRP